jgi:hypothetical protein
VALLGRISIGYLLVIIDVRIDGLDVIPDVVGWLLALTGLWSLWSRHSWFQVAALGAGAGALLSVPQLFAEPRHLAVLLTGAAETALVFGTCSGVLALVLDDDVRRSAQWIRWSDLGLTLVAAAVTVATGETTTEVSGGSALLVVLLVVVALSIAVWFLVFCWRNRHRPELTQPV